jgi:hypothetical protein
LFSGAGGERRPSVGGQFFVGTIERELNGDMRVEGYLFEKLAEAKWFMENRLRRSAPFRILTLTIGKFRVQESRSNREPEISRIPLPSPMREVEKSR